MRDLQELLDRWQNADLISTEQVTAITDFETSREPRRSSLIAEVLGYLGGALAVVAVWVFIAQFWADLETWGKLTLVGVMTVGFVAAGALVRNGSSDTSRRLAGFLWFLAVVGVAGWFGVLADSALDASGDAAALWASAPSFATALVLWLLHRKTLQLAALVVASHSLVLSLLSQLNSAPSDWFGLVVWAIGVACVLLAWGDVLAPKAAAYVLGIAAILLGPSMAGGMLEQSWPLWLGVITAGVLLTASVSLHEVVLLVGGAVAVFVFLPQLIFQYFEDTLGIPVALFLSGALLIGVALLIARLRDEVQTP
jgi:hypothetical protein